MEISMPLTWKSGGDLGAVTPLSKGTLKLNFNNCSLGNSCQLGIGNLIRTTQLGLSKPLKITDFGLDIKAKILALLKGLKGAGGLGIPSLVVEGGTRRQFYFVLPMKGEDHNYMSIKSKDLRISPEFGVILILKTHIR
ncbi:hypothetical protein PVL29_014771 [Vitis rotundifolia]|uniref:Uncharacterized protein n=1 Tax=Vitis rotundifolia TaxID=103349 RepID=A0AA39DLU7_VITRO|nr:hypothetical protein PVL29_014771 [Vitis rotundifolia]